MDLELRKPLIVANWKMHGLVSEVIKWATTLKNILVESQSVEIVAAPPFTALYSASVVLSDTEIKLGAQNLFYEDEGAYTGEISPCFLREVGCQFVLIGHSERRHFMGESDETVNQKIIAAFRNELTPIVCVGETERERETKKTFTRIEQQLKKAFADISLHDFERLVLAYEPIWAIGTGKNATPEQAEEVHHFIRNWLGRYFDGPTANKVNILYGGSVKPSNAAELIKQSEVDGLLVGRASLNARDFAKIIQSV